MLSTKSKIVAVAGFSFIYFATSLFLPNSVLMQTVYNLFVIMLVIMLLEKTHNKAYSFLRYVLLAFWTGQAALFFYNLRYINEEVEIWFYHFNDYSVLIPVYILSIFTGIFYSLWKL